MSQLDSPDDTAAVLTDRGFTFSGDTTASRAVPDEPNEDIDDDDPEFQPKQRRKVHWLTVILIGLIIWGGGFLVGVLVDRALSAG